MIKKPEGTKNNIWYDIFLQNELNVFFFSSLLLSKPAQPYLFRPCSALLALFQYRTVSCRRVALFTLPLLQNPPLPHFQSSVGLSMGYPRVDQVADSDLTDPRSVAASQGVVQR